MRHFLQILVAVTLVTVPAAGQSLSFEARWRGVERFMEESGYELSRSHVEVGGNSDTIDVWVDLRAGSEYVLIGLCDDRCRDLDLRLADFHYNPIAPHVDFADASLLLINPDRSDRYRLLGEVVGCDGASCLIGLAVFRRDGVVTAARRLRRP